MATGGPPGPQRKASLPPPLLSWGLGKSCIHCRAGWQGTSSVRSPASRPHLQAGRPMYRMTESEGGWGAGGWPWGQSHCPGSRSLQETPRAALPRGPGSPLLPGRGLAKACSSRGVVTSAPFRMRQGRAGVGVLAGASRLPQRPYFLSRSQDGPPDKGSAPLGRWREGPAGRRQPPQMVGKVVLGLEVLCAQLVMYKPRKNAWEGPRE